MDFIQDWGLTAMVFTPLAGVALMMLFPKDADDTAQGRSRMLTSLVTAGFGIAVFADFDFDNTGDAAVRPATTRGSTSSTPGTSSASTACRCRSSP